MKWFLVGILVFLARYGEGGAIRCAPDDDNPSCRDLEKGPRCEPGNDDPSCRAFEKVKESELKQGQSCEPETSWRSQCNDCVCSPEGLTFCTDRACPGYNIEMLKECAPDSTWKNKCNRCSCTPDGQAMCTRMECPNFPELNLHKNPQNEEIPDADEEDYYEYDYLENDLTKADQRIKDPHEDNFRLHYLAEELDNSENIENHVKTNQNLVQPDQSLEDPDFIFEEQDKNNLEEHLRDVKPHTVLKRSQVCKPNQAFESECHSCKCASDGQSYTCTQNECMEGEMNKEVEVFMENDGEDHIERHSVCKPRGTFYIGCNTCHCNLYGTDYSCTNKPCPLPEDVELFHELKAFKSSKNSTQQKIVCVANRMFIKDCNTCWCNDDGTGFFCTRKVCVPELPEEASEEEQPEDLRIIKRECRPDEVFELDCNMCRCNPDGKSFSCTRRACLELIDEDAKNISITRKKRGVTQEPLKACQPGQEFRMDCNKCLCDNEGQDFSCTRIDCNALNNNNGGARAKRDTSERITMECSPSSVFDRDCNVCRCTDDGHAATCTTKPCSNAASASASLDNDVNSPIPESDSNFRCNPGEQFKRGCNDCSCSADGKSVFCTVRFCDQDITPPPSL